MLDVDRDPSAGLHPRCPVRDRHHRVSASSAGSPAAPRIVVDTDGASGTVAAHGEGAREATWSRRREGQVHRARGAGRDDDATHTGAAGDGEVRTTPTRRPVRTRPALQFSTVAYSSVLSSSISTVPKSRAASESCGVTATVTTSRRPFSVARSTPVIGPAAAVSNAITSPVFDNAGSAVRARHRGEVGGVEHAPELAEVELGDQQVAVEIVAATCASARQQVGGVGDERDLAAVGVDRRRPRRPVAGLRHTDLDDPGVDRRHDRERFSAGRLVEDPVAVGVAVEAVHLRWALGHTSRQRRQARACGRGR